MTAYTITTAQNIDELLTKTGGDTYAINGGTLTIDQHSRFGLNNNNSAATTATSMGSITLSAALGGTLRIDGRKVRLIQYTGGTGTIPALNSLVTQGGASGKLMCVYSSLTVAPLVNGGAMPATGWIMIKQWNDVEYAAGALTLSGVTATASGASTVGFLEIMGDDAGTITTNRLNLAEILGEFYELGTTSGVANQTLQIPNNGTLHHAAGVQIETAVGSGIFEPWVNAGTATAIAIDSVRGKVVWVDNTGLVRIGHNGTANQGWTPIAGLRVVIGNVFLKGCATTTRNAAKIPHATIATRYDFTTTGGGVVNMSKVDSNWYPSFSQAFAVDLQHVGIVDALLFSELASPITWNNVFVGNKPTTALVVSPLTHSLSFSGGTMDNCVFAKVSTAAANDTNVVGTDVEGFTLTNCTFRYNTNKAFTTVRACLMTRATNYWLINPLIIQGSVEFAQSINSGAIDTRFVDTPSLTTASATNGVTVWTVSTLSVNIKFEGLTLPIAQNWPYTALLSVAAAGCKNIKLRNIGTPAAPLSLGTGGSTTGLIYTLGGAAAADGVYVQRVYVSTTRTGIMSGDNSNKNIQEINVFADYADAADVMTPLNMVRRGCRATGSLTAQVSCYGTHWRDLFKSATLGSIAILMNEPSAATVDQVSLSGTAAFTSAGGLYMPNINDMAVFVMPEYIIGHTGFTATALVMAGGTVGNYSFEYAIDLNDGNGWSTMTGASYTAAALATALNGITGINAALGFKLAIRVTTTTANTTAITSLLIETTSNTTVQAYQYPLDTVPLLVTCKDASTGDTIEGVRVYITAAAGGGEVLGSLIHTAVTDVNGQVSLPKYNLLSTTQPISGRARKSTASPLYKTSVIGGTITTSGLDITVFMIKDE